MLLKNIHIIRGRIVLRSGLHIGAGRDMVEIGGLDQPIIKNPANGEPYIPGSSIKGKMRSLLETSVFMAMSEKTRKHVMNGAPCGCGMRACPACVIFGPHISGNKYEAKLGPTRLLVRDSVLTEEYSRLFQAGQLPMEVKYENIIHRVKGIAEHPRPLERVPAGTEFDFEMALKEFENDEPELRNWIFRGLRIMELDALGGCGSRGSGQVRFVNLTCNGEKEDLETYTTFE